MLLTSCSGGEGDVENPSYVGNMGLTDIPKEIITQNLSADHEGKKADKESPTKVFTNEFSDTSTYSIYSDAHFNDGLLLLEENSTGHVGFFSIPNNRFLIEPYAFNDNYKVEIIHEDFSTIRYIITANYNDKEIIIDSLGNVLYEGETLYDWHYTVVYYIYASQYYLMLDVYLNYTADDWTKTTYAYYQDRTEIYGSTPYIPSVN